MSMGSGSPGIFPLNLKAILFLGDIRCQCPGMGDFSFVSYLEVAWVSQIHLALLPLLPSVGMGQGCVHGVCSLGSWAVGELESGARCSSPSPTTQSLGIPTLWELNWSCWQRRGGVTPWRTPCCSEGLGQSVLGDISKYWNHREGQAGEQPALGQPIHAAVFHIFLASPGICLFVWASLNSSQWQLGTESVSCCSEQLLGMWLQDGAAHTASGMGWKSSSQLALALLLIFFPFWESLVAQRKSRG